MGRRTDRLFGGALIVAVIHGLFIARDTVQAAQDANPTETFPFFRWSLFSTVPEADQTVYTLRFTEMDGVPVEPLLLEESLIPDRTTSGMQTLVLRIAEAIEDERDDDLEHLRAILESRYLYPLASARYEVVKRQVTLEEWRSCSCFTIDEVLAELSMEQR